MIFVVVGITKDLAETLDYPYPNTVLIN